MKDTIEVHLTGYVLKDVGPKDFYDTSRGVYIYERNDAGELRTEEFYPWARVKKIVKHYGGIAPKADPSYVQDTSGLDEIVHESNPYRHYPDTSATVMKHSQTDSPHVHENYHRVVVL